MNIVHISTYSFGGAGTAALRLHNGLVSSGVDSYFLTLQNNSQLIPNVFIYKPPTRKYFFYEKLLLKIKPITNEQKNVNLIKGKKGSYEIFTFPTSDIVINDHPLVKQADIINLHWIARFIDYPSFFKYIQKPIVWTLHDMNPFQGGFHYKNDEINNQREYGMLDREIKEIKRECYQKSNIVQIVSPSKWLLNESANSSLLNLYEHQHIPYGLDFDIYKSYDQKISRQIFNLPAESKILLFVSDVVGSQRKGFEMLSSILPNLAEKENITIVAIGEIPKIKQKGIIYLGSIRDERLMAIAYSAADIFVLPTKEDNLPNVALESLACGTPIIATPVGGLLDIIENGFNGYLSKDVSKEELKIAIYKYLENPTLFVREKIRKDAKNKYSLLTQAERYIMLYKKILLEKSK